MCGDAVVNPCDLPKLVSRVSQCSTERSAGLLRTGGIYTLESAEAELLSALCIGPHCSATEGLTHPHGDSCKHKERARSLPTPFCGGCVGEHRLVCFCLLLTPHCCGGRFHVF